MSISPEPWPSSPQERLRVGECTVEIPLREIHAPDARRPRRVTPKAMGVLLVLAGQGGRVVSRDALLAQVWPDTLPTNDVVTQAITQLRKAFGDDSGNPRYIETIAKNGYRLLAPVEWLGDGDLATAEVLHADNPVEAEAIATRDGVVARTNPVPVVAVAITPARESLAAPMPVPVPATRKRRLAVGVLAVASALIAVIALWSWRHQPSSMAAPVGLAVLGPPIELPYKLITSVPGTESSPSLSPDAALVAYAAIPQGQRRSVILVQTTDPSLPRQLTHPAGAAEDSAPAWSPDGREIAFLRVVPGQDCKVLVAPANGGTERGVGACDSHNPPSSFDWTHDGRGLVFGNRGTLGDDPGLHVLDLASGVWRSLDTGASAQDVDFAPRYSPDGRWIVFVRNSPVGDFWRIPATGGNAQRLTSLHADIRGWDWTPDGRGLVFGRWSDSESRLLQLDLTSGTLHDLGIVDGGDPVMASTRAALAFVQTRNYFGIYRSALGSEGKGERLFASSGRDRLPVIAPDARQLVFTSDRSGEFGLWWSEAQRPDSLRLIEGVRPESWHPPEWSPDSRRLLVTGNGGDGKLGLYEVTPADGRVARLPSPIGDVVQALYLPGTELPDRDRILLVAGAAEGPLRLMLYDRSAQPWRALAAIGGVAVARVDRAGRRVLFTRVGQPGLWQADLALSPASVRELDAQTPSVAGYRAWTVADDGGIYVMERTPNCSSALRRLGGDKTTRCIDRERRAGPHGFSVSTRTNALFITVSEWDGGDIGFMALPTAAEVAGPD